jgi:uncharacterized protein YacL
MIVHATRNEYGDGRERRIAERATMKVCVMIVVFLSIVASLIGLVSTAFSLQFAVTHRVEMDLDKPGVEQIFYSMLGICTILNVSLLCISILLVIRRRKYLWHYTVLLHALMVYFLVAMFLTPGELWFVVVSLSPIANAGIVPHLVLLLPLWAPLVLLNAFNDERK